MNRRRGASRGTLVAAAVLLAVAGCESSPTFPPPTSSLVAVTAGLFHTCALDAEGRAYCWGANGSGQLGIGRKVSLVTLPAPVAKDLRFRSLSAGVAHTCGVLVDGGAACWGENRAGALGDGTRESRREPVRVRGLEDVTLIAAGDAFTCALAGGGRAYCWGLNGFGQLGDGTSRDAWAPVAVTGVRRYSAVSAGGGHACALDTGGTAFCWGANGSEQLGSAGSPERRVPVRVQGALVFRQLSAGPFHTCGLDEAGAAHCWGSNAGGALGDAELERQRSAAPVPVAGGHAYSRIEAAWQSWSCGVLETGELACWGTSSGGVFGTEGETRLRGAVVLPVGRWTALAPGGDHLCGRASGGGLFCWGLGAAGQLGNGARRAQTVPSPVPASGSGA